MTTEETAKTVVRQMRGAMDFALERGVKAAQFIHLVEYHIIVQSLKRNKGNVCAVGRELGWHRNTVDRKCEQHQILPAMYRKP